MASPSSEKTAPPHGVLLLNEDEVRRLLTMDMALEAVEQGLRKMALDEAQIIPRHRAVTDHATLHVMAATAKSLGVMGSKVYATGRKGVSQFLVSLFDGKTAALLALIQADYLGQVRTGAASGVATKYMARPDASEVGLIGSGKQARTQLEAMCKVRKIRRATVFSPNEERRNAFAAEMSTRCEIEVIAVARPEQAVEAKDIIITATTSREPVLSGQWVPQGAYQRRRLQLSWQGRAGRGHPSQVCRRGRGQQGPGPTRSGRLSASDRGRGAALGQHPRAEPGDRGPVSRPQA